ncbi:MAG TPA: hypothetical protein VFN87_07480 [Solirubrobacteraceae bacterium]|nr:hypothetical protein [Solirubrobacteraceae bacterium]
MLSYLIVLVVLAAAVYFISGPLRAARQESESDRTLARLADLEAARDAKYREIRDAELDLRTGKLSEADYEAIDRALRAEAIDILHRLDEVQAEHQPA